jgi:hypothetical protein
MTIAVQVRTLQARLVELAALTGRPAPVLGKPASKAKLARLEAAIGKVPAQVRQLLTVADGWSDITLIETATPVFSCAELASPERAAFVEAARETRGFRGDRVIQHGFIFGGGGDIVFVVSPDPPVRVMHVGLRPRSIGATGTLARFLELWTLGIAHRIREAGEQPADRITEAVRAFNYPNEMGEDVHESIETLRVILGELPARSRFAAPLRLLREELQREAMRFIAARRTGDTIEVELDGRWVPIDHI